MSHQIERRRLVGRAKNRDAGACGGCRGWGSVGESKMRQGCVACKGICNARGGGGEVR